MKMTKAAACLAGLAGLTVTAAVLTSAPAAAGQATTRRVQAPTFMGGGARLGISIRDVGEDDAKTARLSTPAGAIVDEVSEGSVAEKGGLRKGDVIVEFDGERVRSARQLTRLVQETAEGRRVSTVVMRDGQRVTLTVEPKSGDGTMFDFRDLEDWGRSFRYQVPRAIAPAVPAPPRGRTPPPTPWPLDDLLGRRSGRIGITVDSLSPQLAEYFGTKQGVLITSVQDNSVGAKAGLKAGDVITSVNGSVVDDSAELRRRLQSLDDGDEFTIAVMRDKKAVTVKGKVEQPVRRRTYRSII
jgi:serine protease Do